MLPNFMVWLAARKASQATGIELVMPSKTPFPILRQHANGDPMFTKAHAFDIALCQHAEAGIMLHQRAENTIKAHTLQSDLVVSPNVWPPVPA